MQHVIGFIEDTACDSATTRRQIDALRNYVLDIRGPGGEEIHWLDIDSPDEPRTFLRAIEGDRRIRIDEKTLMADRPPFAVITEEQGRITRIEYYEGHDALELMYDLRSPDLQGKLLQRFLDHHPQAYDPREYLAGLGFPEEVLDEVMPLIHDAHTDLRKEM